MLRFSTCAIVAAMMATACNDAAAPSLRDLEALLRARQQWQATGIDDYELVMRHNCFCPLGGQAIRVVVRDGVVQSRRVVATGETVSSSLFATRSTIEGLFAVLAEALEREPAAYRASYDGRYGYPRSASIDYEARAVDEEYGFEIDSFTRLP